MGIGLLILGFVFIAVLVSHSSSSQGAQDSSSVTTPQAISISAPRLWADYNANEVAADNKYKGRRLVVQGQVGSISKGIVDDVYLLLSTYNEFESVHADLRAEYKSEAAELHIGQIITVDCEGGGMVLGSPFLKDCSIQPNAPPVQSIPEAEPQPQSQPAPITPVQYTNAAPNQVEDPNATGNSVTPPALINQVAAEYSAEARVNKLQGSVQLILLVDENGDPQNVTVVRSLGMGLDESAVEAVKHYKFKPAVNLKTGQTVPAQVSINVQFRLY